MSETELPEGKTKFFVGQKIDSIELRATKMAAKGEGAISWKADRAKPPNPLRLKKRIVTDHSDKAIQYEEYERRIESRNCSEPTGMVRGRGVEPLRPFGH